MEKEEHAMKTESSNVLCMVGIVGEIAKYKAIGETTTSAQRTIRDFRLYPSANGASARTGIVW